MGLNKRKIAVIDAETDPFIFGEIPEPFVWGFYDGQTYKHFFSTFAMVEYIKKFKGIIYAHNGGKFDYHFLLNDIEPGTPITVINGRIAKLKFGKAELRDSYNILPVPLRDMDKDEFDYNKMHKNNRQKHMDEILIYLRHDCEYLHYNVMAFIETFGIGLTLAGTAFNVWHDMSKRDKPKMMGKQGQAYYEKFSPYYYGGRVTPFKVGCFKGDFEMIDINSAYPKAMTTEHPYGHKFYETTKIPDNKLKLAMITIKGKSSGALPFREKTSLSFPHKTDIFHITGHEFIAGLKTNTLQVEKIIKAYVPKETINFTPYVERFFKMKQDADKAGNKEKRLLAKLFLNSLYGKYCANPAKYTDDILMDPDPPFSEIKEIGDKGFAPGIILGNNRLWSKIIDEHKQLFYNVVTGASITGYVRAFLWESILSVENPYYCDTDSIICENTNKLKMGKELGEWSLEMKGKELDIAGKKLYCLRNGTKNKKACKGAQLTPKEIRILANGGEVVYNQAAPIFSVKNQVRFLSRKIRKTA